MEEVRVLPTSSGVSLNWLLFLSGYKLSSDWSLSRTKLWRFAVARELPRYSKRTLGGWASNREMEGRGGDEWNMSVRMDRIKHNSRNLSCFLIVFNLFLVNWICTILWNKSADVLKARPTRGIHYRETFCLKISNLVIDHVFDQFTAYLFKYKYIELNEKKKNATPNYVLTKK